MPSGPDKGNLSTVKSKAEETWSEADLVDVVVINEPPKCEVKKVLLYQYTIIIGIVKPET